MTTLTKGLAKPMACAALALFFLLSIPTLIREASFVSMLDEAGYGDSYILYDVLHFQKTGMIYRDLSQPPYLPAQYSPLVYMFYSLPGRISTWQNPFVGPRLLALTSFLACVAIVASIVVVLVPVRFAGVWGALLASSIGSVSEWVLQIRADFPAICCSLLAIRLLLSRSRWAVPLAGLFAGLAIQFKLTFVAAAVAGVIWLSIRHRWTDVAKFAVAAAVFSGGLYMLYSLREPGMWSQMLALSPGITNVTGNVMLLEQATGDLVVLLAAAGLALVVRRFWPRWALVIIFATTSLGMAALANFQAGGNINYYFEALFAAIPLAALGLVRLLALAPRNAIFTFCVLALFGVHFLVPRALYSYHRIRDEPMSNEAFRNVERVLHGRHMFSTEPRLALLDPAPPLVEPYLLYYMERLGKLDPEPIYQGLRNGRYDLVTTAPRPLGHRNLPRIGPKLRDAIAAGYRPHCTLLGRWLVHLPARAHSDTSELARDLAGIGCEAVSPASSAGW